jgi:hypothetical protein
MVRVVGGKNLEEPSLEEIITVSLIYEMLRPYFQLFSQNTGTNRCYSSIFGKKGTFPHTTAPE